MSSDAGTANGLPLQLYGGKRDRADTDQKWFITADGYIVNRLSGRCLDVKAPSGTANELRLQLYHIEWTKANAD